MLARMLQWTVAGLMALMLGGCISEGVWQTDRIVEETFDKPLGARWWVEGGEKVWIEDGRLYVKADPPQGGDGSMCTVWYRRPIAGDMVIEYDAHVMTSEPGVNNINLFFCYSDPSEKSLSETREARSDASYGKYQALNGYIITFLRDVKKEGGAYSDGTVKARIRLHRCPGFELLAETYAGHCEADRTYHCKIVRRGGHIEFHVNGTKYLQADDPMPLSGGLIGLRTFRTTLWWDNIRVRALRD